MSPSRHFVGSIQRPLELDDSVNHAPRYPHLDVDPDVTACFGCVDHRLGSEDLAALAQCGRDSEQRPGHVDTGSRSGAHHDKGAFSLELLLVGDGPTYDGHIHAERLATFPDT